MKILLKSFKTEINPTAEQKHKVNRTIGTCRFVYNFYLAHNRKIYEQENRFVSGYDFSIWLNNDYIPNNPEFAWIKEVSSKSVKQSIMNAQKAYKNFFDKKASFPKWKKKNNSDVKMYFVRTDSKAMIFCERHRLKIPTLGWVRLKEKGYIPTSKDGYIIKSGTVSCKAGRYYVTVLNINKSSHIRKLEKKLNREQRRLSRKYESLKKSKNNLKGEVTRQNIRKQKLKVQKLHHRLDCIRTDYINKAISELVKTKPMWITLEDLNIRGMMKNRHLSKAVAQQKFFEFRTKLTEKCKEYSIELRLVDRFYPSSKLCYNCGCVKSDLKLSDRIYVCSECGYMADRDFNASLNLRDCLTYQIA